MVDVGDDGDVADIFTLGHPFILPCGGDGLCHESAELPELRSESSPADPSPGPRRAAAERRLCLPVPLPGLYPALPRAAVWRPLCPPGGRGPRVRAAPGAPA